MRTLEEVKRIFEGVADPNTKINIVVIMVIPMTCAEIVHMRMVQRAKQICNYFIATNGGIEVIAHQRLDN